MKETVHTDPARYHIAQSIYGVVQKYQQLSHESLSWQDIHTWLERPPELHMGDFALPCFRFAKILKQNPKQIAVELKEKLEDQGLSPWLKEVKVIGAFLNFFVDQHYLARHLLPQILSGAFFTSFHGHPKHSLEKIMVEYSQPNTHKQFHVGHGRNVCLGNSLCRLLTYMGYQVIGANYIGDEGTHVAKCLWEIDSKKHELPKEDQVEWFGSRYVEINDRLKASQGEEKEKLEKEISKVLSALEKKEGHFYELWQQTRQLCLDDFNRIYKWLGVDFDRFYYESEVSEEAQEIVDEYLKKGLFKKSEGAIGIDMEPYKLGFFMVRKSDGTTPYITKDLSLARRKFSDYLATKSLYVVGNEQNFHFQQLFKAMELMEFEHGGRCFHVSYAHVKRPEGKMSSRLGNTFTFNQLIKIILEEVEKYLDKYKDMWSVEELHDTAQKLAVGAIKYGMLAIDAPKEIIFDPEKWTSFEGNSGPYLMYSYTRSVSILNKYRQQYEEPKLECLQALSDPAEFQLLRSLYDFNEVVSQATTQYRPSLVANHLYNTCKAFNRFYAAVSVLGAKEEQERSARILLVDCFSKTLKEGLNLLGIVPPKRM